MEYTSEKCKKKHIKRVNLVTYNHSSDNDSSDTSLSSNSESNFHPYKCVAKQRRKSTGHPKRDYLSRLYERKKLKDKSLSKKLKTPFDRKINRTCWPIELEKVSKIKKKPQEKRRQKPNQRSLTRRKFSDPTFITTYKTRSDNGPQIACSELEFLDDELFKGVYQYINKKHYLYEQVTPQMLMAVLQEPEYLETGASIDMIIKELRTLKLDLNPAPHQLREEISQKLNCAIKLGLVVENEGYYRIASNFREEKLSRKRIDDIWELWYRRISNCLT